MHDNVFMLTSDADEKAARPAAAVSRGTHRLFVRDLELESQIGVRPHERGRSQRVRLNIELTVRDSARPVEDRYENVVCYDEVISAVRRLVAAGHVNLVETLAERIAGLCLEDPRVEGAKVRVEKLDVYPDAGGVGVEIERFRASSRTIISHLR
ncbi:MAG TPA: dihydroneopterin aldolase [Alphaproteobacteria bacterium]|nr:dihydroneopterin aldolase [Alphaproteobacteria bacterium]